jgi:hypothetical protein
VIVSNEGFTHHRSAVSPAETILSDFSLLGRVHNVFAEVEIELDYETGGNEVFSLSLET